jgi:hypothetical protein
VCHLRSRANSGPVFSEEPIAQSVSKTPSGECNAITKRCCGEGDLTSWKWKILAFHPPSWAATLNGDTIGKGVRSKSYPLGRHQYCWSRRPGMDSHNFEI